ncbi:MAG: thermonuclease family protein [Ruminococcus sp.]|nr:thermonuclease family protein [Ruminococcus sp.]
MKKFKNIQLAMMITFIGIAAIIFSFQLEKSTQSTPPVHDSSATSSEEAMPELHGLYNVVRVVDGDTIVVDIDGAETKIRFIGVDTPESVNPDKSLNTEQGKIASEFTADMLTGKQIYLEYDTERTDKYGRTLAYVFLSDKFTMVEAELLKSGMAEVMTIEPNSKYALYFEELEAEAKQNKVGFWSESN